MIPRPILWMSAASGFVMLMLLGAIAARQGETALLHPDSFSIAQVGRNVLAGHGFSREHSPPYLPDAQRMPIYALLVAGSLGVSGHFWPLFLLQIALATMFPILVFLIGKELVGRNRGVTLAAALTAFEPLMLYWPLTLLAETVFLFFVLLGAWYFARFLKSPRVTLLCTSALWVGVASLTRQNGYPLFFLGACALVWHAARNARQWRRSLGHIGAFALIFFLVISPWLVRNWYHFRVVNLTTNGPVNLYPNFGGSVLAVKRGTTYQEESRRLQEQFEKEIGVSGAFQKRDLSVAHEIAGRGVKLILENPGWSVLTELLILHGFFTNDAYLYTLQRHGLFAPHASTIFSPTLTLFQKGVGETARLVWEKYRFAGTVFVAGRAVWYALFLACVIGAAALMRNARTRASVAYLASIVAVFALGGSVIGFGVDARIRYPANPFIFLLAGVGMAWVRSLVHQPSSAVNLQTDNYKKHTRKNPLQRLFINRFYAIVLQEAKNIAPETILDVGCGEGFTLKRLQDVGIGKTLEGVDFSEIALRIGTRTFPNFAFKQGNAYDLPYNDSSVDLVFCLEVLEHLENPRRALEELSRVTKEYAIISVPNEPFFMLGNLLRGKNIMRLGNDREHIQRWTRKSFAKFVALHFDVVSVRHPFPWTVVVARKKKTPAV